MTDTPHDIEKYEKDSDASAHALPSHPTQKEIHADDIDHEVFKDRVGENETNYKSVHWLGAAAIFLKVQFSLGVLSIPGAFAVLGSVPASLLIIAAGAMNTYIAIFLGQFRERHPGTHSIGDMAYIVGGPIFREIAGLWFVVGFILCVGSGLLATSVAFNTFSEHGACTVWYVFAAFAISTAFAAFPKFSEMSWISWAGAVSIITSVFVMVIAVAVRDRPYAAPPGVTDFGWRALGHPNFISGITSTTLIFVSSSGHSAFIPVISEMKNPKDYNKAVYLCYGITNTCYLVFCLVVFRYAGAYVASPSLGSAGVQMQKICYGIALIGLLASSVIYHHVAAKYIFVRILRNSVHLQKKSAAHWGVWFGATLFVGVVSFILTSSIPIFSYLIALLGSFCFAPLAILIPCSAYLYMWRYEVRHGGKRLMGLLHVTLFVCGLIIFIGGTTAVCIQIRDAYRNGLIDKAFSCADNSGLGRSE